MTRETLTFPTYEEAIAEAVRGAPPGEVIEIHGETCAGREDPETYEVVDCTCEPMTFVAGGAAA